MERQRHPRVSASKPSKSNSGKSNSGKFISASPVAVQAKPAASPVRHAPPPIHFNNMMAPVQAKPASSTVRHNPPPTRFDNAAALPVQAKSAPSPVRHNPPPTQFDKAALPVQAKLAFTHVRHSPPPTRFGGPPAVQPKLTPRPVHAVPAGHGGGARLVQAKPAPMPAWPGRGVVQRMEEQKDEGEDELLAFSDNEDVVEAILTYLSTEVSPTDPLSGASELDVYLGLEMEFPSKDFPVGIQELGLTSIRDLVNEVSGSIRRFLGSSLSSGSAGGGWAMTAIRRAAIEMVASQSDNPIFPGKRYTLHHKISRNDLKKFLKGLDENEQEALTTLLRDQMKSLVGVGAESASLEKLLLNMPPNLEIGPPADLRDGDPGSGFDGNVASGALTPRSHALNGVTSATNFEEVRRRLEAAFDAHGNQVISAPRSGLWDKARGGKFRKL